MKIKKGDKVIVLSGDDKGKTGEVRVHYKTVDGKKIRVNSKGESLEKKK